MHSHAAAEELEKEEEKETMMEDWESAQLIRTEWKGREGTLDFQ